MLKQLSWLVAAPVCIASVGVFGQSLPQSPIAQSPVIQQTLVAQMGSQPSGQTGAPVSQSGSVTAPVTEPDGSVLLTRVQAEQIAVKNNPRISVSRLLSLAQKQVVREERSNYLPTIAANLTGVGADQATRLSSGQLESSRLLNHVGGGVEFDQLIYDFGRTRNLVASSGLEAKAAVANSEATREDIILAADLAFYNALEAQATAQVAVSTEAARQAVDDQVQAKTAAKLKSDLDQSFADVNLSQAQLLVLNTKNAEEAAMAQLAEVLGSTSTQTHYHLVDDATLPTPELPLTVDPLIAMALQQRPDLMAQQLTRQADEKFVRAQHDQILPTISGVGVVGGTAYGSSQYYPGTLYGAGGVNVRIPVFNGFLFSAQTKEADYRAKASAESSRQLTDQIVRDVQTAWLRANNARQKMAVTNQLLKQANLALELAKTRYQLGLSSIVELSQAELQQTQAQIEDANARFEYEGDMATVRFQTASQP